MNNCCSKCYTNHENFPNGCINSACSCHIKLCHPVKPTDQRIECGLCGKSKCNCADDASVKPEVKSGGITHEELFRHRNKLCKCFVPHQPEEWEKGMLEIIKSIMFADNVDWEMSLTDESITYQKSYQLHGKIRRVFTERFNKLLLQAKADVAREIIKQIENAPASAKTMGWDSYEGDFIRDVLQKFIPKEQ